jgi:4-amino-4-deoxy-L-arabinose transferase-like glycosyltransferase
VRRSLVWATAAALLVGATALVVALQRDVGVARDETVYMHHGSRYADWWIGLVTADGVANKQAITATWGGKEVTANNREHPPLMKTLFGLSEKVLHDRLGVTSELTAYRAPSALAWGVLVALVFLFTAAVWGYAEGLVAALLVLLLPRGLFHAGLAAFDAPITTLWFATIVAYWKALASRRWSWGLGVAFGLALATKHNAIILPAVVLAHYALLGVLGRDRQRPWWRAVPAALARRQPWAPAALLLGPLVLLALWPWLWLDPLGHARDWIAFHLDHVHYNFEYLGDNWNHPPFPWHVALVTTGVTVPVVTLAAGGLGAGVLAMQARRGAAADPGRAPGLLLLLSLGAAMGPFVLGSTPIFGAEKHWGPAIPSIAIAAGIGLVWAARRAAAFLIARVPALEARARAVTHGALVAVAGLAVAASATEVAVSHPYGLTHYNALAGGAAGGADLGMNRQFWGVAARGVLPWLADQPPGAVYTHDASPAWGLYRRWGRVPADFPDAGSEFRGGIERSRYALVIHERHFNRHDYLIWAAYGTVQPAFVLRAAGVPVVTVYRRPP